MIDLDTRYRAVAHYKHFCQSLRRVSSLYRVSKSSLQRWVHSSPAFRRRRPKCKMCADIQSCIQKQLEDDPFTTASQLTHIIERTCHVTRSRSTVSKYIKQSGFSRKKAFRIVHRIHDPEHVRAFCNDYTRSSDRIVCIDEAGFYVGDHGRYGYCKRGRRLNIASTSTLRRSKFTLLMAVSERGIVGYKILTHNCRKNGLRFVH